MQEMVEEYISPQDQEDGLYEDIGGTVLVIQSSFNLIVIVAATATPLQTRRRLIFAACTLAAWLHLASGLSRDSSHRVLKVLGIIIRASAAMDVAAVPIPTDVRTAMARLSIEPVIIRSICCPKCFRGYSLANLPQTCLRRETSRSQPCNTPLWAERQTRAGPKIVPQRLYNTQDFHSWLSHFLSRPGIEELIRKSQQHVPNPDRMSSIWDSPAWQSLGPFTSLRNHLVFSYYIDWYNPFTNKIAGKSASCGAIMAFCLNLPLELQHLVENTFFVGITPPPKEPTVTTINALSDPVMDQFLEMWKGRHIQTYEQPDGALHRVAVIPAIGDLLALKKLLGFAGHASPNFCSFCKLLRSEIDRLDHANFVPRNGAEILHWAKAWLLAPTKAKRAEIFKAHGCKWSSSHKLIYRDPVKHTVLGLMHNWLEGILQHHCRLKWGIGSDVSGAGQVADTDSDSDAELMDIDEDMLEDELAGLHQDSFRQQDAPTHLTRTESFVLANDNDDDPNQATVDLESDEEDADYVDDEEEIYVTERTNHVFDAHSIALIRAGLAAVVIPAWIDRPPVNLGEKSHGKLKADNWLVLFTIFFPLIIPELWHQPSSSSKDKKLLRNFDDLMTATNILCSYKTSPPEADIYLDHYISYLESSQSLFPGLTTRPNHHYAIHNAEQMKWWGPLMPLSEFMYESHNGRLQKIKTNNHMCKLLFNKLNLH